jgi:olfactory receptor
VLWLSFCIELKIFHLFCELAQVLKVDCSDTLISNILLFVVMIIFGGGLSGMIFSYVPLVSSVLRMPSSEGKDNAFSTCVSHSSGVFLFYGTGFRVTLTLQLLTRPEKLQWLQWLQGFSSPSNAESLYLQSMDKDIKQAVRKLTNKTTSLL